VWSPDTVKPRAKKRTCSTADISDNIPGLCVRVLGAFNMPNAELIVVESGIACVRGT
jgi:hypothetical protein